MDKQDTLASTITAPGSTYCSCSAVNTSWTSTFSSVEASHKLCPLHKFSVSLLFRECRVGKQLASERDKSLAFPLGVRFFDHLSTIHRLSIKRSAIFVMCSTQYSQFSLIFTKSPPNSLIDYPIPAIIRTAVDSYTIYSASSDRSLHKTFPPPPQRLKNRFFFRAMSTVTLNPS